MVDKSHGLIGPQWVEDPSAFTSQVMSFLDGLWSSYVVIDRGHVGLDPSLSHMPTHEMALAAMGVEKWFDLTMNTATKFGLMQLLLLAFMEQAPLSGHLHR